MRRPTPTGRLRPPTALAQLPPDSLTHPFPRALLRDFAPSGINRGKEHKRRATGGKRCPLHKKRKHELGRPAAMTKIGEKRVHTVRCRGGNMKYRAMRLNTGNIAWGTEVVTQKVSVLDVVYNASNNELVRTKTLVKGAIVLVDAKPFQNWYQNHYGVEIGKKKQKGASKFAEEFVSRYYSTCLQRHARATTEDRVTRLISLRRNCVRLSLSLVADPLLLALTSQAEKHPLKHEETQKKFAARQQSRVLAATLDDQFSNGRLLARITSRPGQTGRVDGYVLEAKELDFYQRALAKKKSKK